tara:strand:- start:84 stop:530 length:447 start_codon:yes stop_codon:yes gene_type:complete
MKKLILLLLFITLISCDISSLFYPSLNTDDFPFKIEPFDKKSELMESSKNDPLCGTFKYYSGESENGVVDIFKYDKVYYLHYKRDDNAQYVGIGIKNENNFSVTYYYPDGSDFGIVYYKIDENNLLQGYWSSFNTPGDLIKEGTTEKL